MQISACSVTSPAADFSLEVFSSTYMTASSPGRVAAGFWDLFDDSNDGPYSNTALGRASMNLILLLLI